MVRERLLGGNQLAVDCAVDEVSVDEVTPYTLARCKKLLETA